MELSGTSIVPRIEAILTIAKTSKNDDLPARLGLMKEVQNLYSAMEPPMNSVYSSDDLYQAST
jgi:hypothetical protein